MLSLEKKKKKKEKPGPYGRDSKKVAEMVVKRLSWALH